MESTKVARVIERDGRLVMSFNKATVTALPPSLFLQGGAHCKITQNCGKEYFEKNIRARGIIAGELACNERVEVVGVDDFYERLYCHGLENPSIVVFFDEDLKTALAAKLPPVPGE